MSDKIFYFHRERGSLWFRIFGRGLSFIDRRIHYPLFSERHRLVKICVIGHWTIRWLGKVK